MSDKIREAEQSSQGNTAWLHLLLAVGFLGLVASLGQLTFSALSDFMLHQKTTAPSGSNYFSLILLVLFAWWLHACWRSIFKREPNTTSVYLRRHRVTAILAAALLGVVFCVSATRGVQNGRDRISMWQLREAEHDLVLVAQRISEIKNRDLLTSKEYIDAYNEINPLLSDFTEKLQQYENVISEVRRRDENRNIFYIQKPSRRHQQWMNWNTEMLPLLRQENEIIQEQVRVVRQMAALPEYRQGDFWNRQFEPLAQEEYVLRQKISSLLGKKPSGVVLGRGPKRNRTLARSVFQAADLRKSTSGINKGA